MSVVMMKVIRIYTDPSLDLHLRNILATLPTAFESLPTKQIYKKYGIPETMPITRRDGKPLPPNIPTKAVLPLYLGNTQKSSHYPTRIPSYATSPEDGAPTESHKKNKWPPSDESFVVGVQKGRRMEGGQMGDDEKGAFLDLMRWTLSFRPECRPSADEVLGSERMVKWALAGDKWL